MGAQDRTADPRRALGALGEELAAAHLERRGYRIADRNFRTAHGELDLVAYDERCLVFCEVKTRRAGGSRGPAMPLDAIGSGKRRQLRSMAREWLRRRSGVLPHRPDQIRFDAIGIIVDGRGGLVALEHVEGGF